MEDVVINKDKLIYLTKKLVGFMNLDCEVELGEEARKNGKTITVAISAPDNGKFLIGKNGQNLRALEHLLKTITLKESEVGVNLVVDVNDYKKSKASYVIELAKQAVMRVRNTQKAEALAPMSAYERRVVHMELASYPDIATESIGEEPQRRIVIKPYSISI
jgi:spoIIIJ-associated protein